jgi:large subunit ribosomal protein L29
MTAQEIKGMSDIELKDKIKATKDEYQKLRFDHAISPISQTHTIREMRRLIARLQTEVSLRNKAIITGKVQSGTLDLTNHQHEGQKDLLTIIKLAKVRKFIKQQTGE